MYMFFFWFFLVSKNWNHCFLRENEGGRTSEKSGDWSISSLRIHGWRGGEPTNIEKDEWPFQQLAWWTAGLWPSEAATPASVSEEVAGRGVLCESGHTSYIAHTPWEPRRHIAFVREWTTHEPFRGMHTYIYCSKPNIVVDRGIKYGMGIRSSEVVAAMFCLQGTRWRNDPWMRQIQRLDFSFLLDKMTFISWLGWFIYIYIYNGYIENISSFFFLMENAIELANGANRRRQLKQAMGILSTDAYGHM